MKTRHRRRTAHRDTRLEPRRSTNILTLVLTIGTIGAFVAEGITGSPAALVVGNAAAILLGIVLALRPSRKRRTARESQD